LVIYQELLHDAWSAKFESSVAVTCKSKISQLQNSIKLSRFSNRVG